MSKKSIQQGIVTADPYIFPQSLQIIAMGEKDRPRRGVQV